MKRLQALGLGTAQRKATFISIEDEESMDILGDGSPWSPLNTMVYMNGQYFPLGGGKEHIQLQLQASQIMPTN